MSSALAIAAVTAVLKDLLQNGVIDREVTAGIGSVTVSALPPDRIPIDATEDSRLNLYMYCVTPNQGWRNVGLPSYNARGDRMTNPPLALNLHYMLTAYGNEEYHAEILLGFAMQLFHENPILQRAAIDTALNPQVPVTGTELPPVLRALRASDLDDQVESIKLTPHTMDSEEISRLWTAFQSHYRPSAAYVASVVLIESDRPVRPTLPVLQSNLAVNTIRHPTIDRVTATAGALILPQSTVELDGSGYSSAALPIVQVDAVDVAPANVTPINDSRLRAVLPGGLSAGAHGIQLIHTATFGASVRPGERSNAAPFILHPTIQKPGADYNITVSNVVDAGDGTRSATFTVLVTPTVLQTQQALLELVRADGSLLLFNADARSADTNTLVFQVAGVTPDSYFVRVRVDGAESPFELDASQQPSAPVRTIA